VFTDRLNDLSDFSRIHPNHLLSSMPFGNLTIIIASLSTDRTVIELTGVLHIFNIYNNIPRGRLFNCSAAQHAEKSPTFLCKSTINQNVQAGSALSQINSVPKVRTDFSSSILNFSTMYLYLFDGSLSHRPINELQ
jgi:hypothetical protein